MTDLHGQCVTHPACLQYEPHVRLLSEDLEKPADDWFDVLWMVGDQCL